MGSGQCPVFPVLICHLLLGDSSTKVSLAHQFNVPVSLAIVSPKENFMQGIIKKFIALLLQILPVRGLGRTWLVDMHIHVANYLYVHCHTCMCVCERVCVCMYVCMCRYEEDWRIWTRGQNW
jgi:hypothetical protein